MQMSLFPQINLGWKPTTADEPFSVRVNRALQQKSRDAEDHRHPIANSRNVVRLAAQQSCRSRCHPAGVTMIGFVSQRLPRARYLIDRSAQLVSEKYNY
jgi:hypothetical protein